MGKVTRRRRCGRPWRGAMRISGRRNRRWGRWCALFIRSIRDRFMWRRSADSSKFRRRRTKGNRRSCSRARTAVRPESKREILLDVAGGYPPASLMSSRAFLSASLASTLALLSGFRRSIALWKSMALPPAGPAQESATGLGFTPVTSHFKQVNSIFNERLTRRDATQSSRYLNPEQASCKFYPAVRILELAIDVSILLPGLHLMRADRSPIVAHD